MTSAARRTCPGLWFFFRTPAQPRIGASGVRNSCETTARNSSFAAAAASSFTTASSYCRVR